MNITKPIILISLLFLLSSCAHNNNYKDVRPGLDGLNKVVVLAPDTEAGSQNALSQATSYCKSQSKNLAVVKESSEYTGDMDEQTYNHAKRVAKVAGVVGLGEKAQNALGDAYTVQIDFKCQ